jgi:hemerythrin-like metal-binding protein
MDFIEWNGRLVLHDESINGEHRTLMRKANTLHNAVREGMPAETTLPLMDELIRSLREHCAHEEQEMFAVGYPAAEQHQDNHLSYCTNLLEIRERIAQGSAASVLTDITFVLSWLATHINKADRAADDYIFRHRAHTSSAVARHSTH